MIIKGITNNRTFQFWILNLLGWFGYSFFSVLPSILSPEYSGISMGEIIVSGLSGLLCTVILRESAKISWNYALPLRFLFLFLMTMIITVFWVWLKMHAMFWFNSVVGSINLLYTPSKYITWFKYSFFILCGWLILYLGVKYYQIAQQQKTKLLSARTVAYQAQLKMLRYQLNPHFLFNTLNAISTLILDDKKIIANKMVSRLSGFLRYSLDNDPMQKINLAQEIEALKLYLDIEKTRFDERLKLEFIIEDKANQALIPSMLLQPLVENSIKYAIALSETGGTIRLEAKVFADKLLLILSDDGPGIVFDGAQLPKFCGVGINNTTERLQEIYGDSQSCQFSTAEPHGLRVTIRMPFEVKK